MKKLVLIKLSICPCGAPVLKEEIKIGTEYKVVICIPRNCVYTCGSCGYTQITICVLANSVTNPLANMKPLPLGLFMMQEQIEELIYGKVKGGKEIKE